MHINQCELLKKNTTSPYIPLSISLVLVSRTLQTLNWPTFVSSLYRTLKMRYVFYLCVCSFQCVFLVCGCVFSVLLLLIMLLFTVQLSVHCGGDHRQEDTPLSLYRKYIIGPDPWPPAQPACSLSFYSPLAFSPLLSSSSSWCTVRQTSDEDDDSAVIFT